MSYFFLHDSLLVFEDPAIDSTSRYLDVGRTLPRRRVCDVRYLSGFAISFPLKGISIYHPQKGLKAFRLKKCMLLHVFFFKPFLSNSDVSSVGNPEKTVVIWFLLRMIDDNPLL